MHLCNTSCNLEVKVRDVNPANISYFMFTLETSLLVNMSKHKRFHLNIRKHWNRLPKEVVEFLSLKVLKSHLDKQAS